MNRYEENKEVHKMTPKEALKNFKLRYKEYKSSPIKNEKEAIFKLGTLRNLQKRAVLAQPIITAINPVRYGWAGTGNNDLYNITTEKDKFNIAENWMNTIQKDHPSVIKNTAIKLGDWSLPNINLRDIFSERPLFIKTLSTKFEPEISIGFTTHASKDEFIQLIKQERDLVTDLLHLLQKGPCKKNNTLFNKFRDAYMKWATEQAAGEKKWEKDISFDIQLFILSKDIDKARNILEQLKKVRSEFMKLTYNINLTEHPNSIILVPTGTFHAIMGLSMQSHPIEGIKDQPTKSEAWIYLPVYNSNGEIINWVLLEPQETSNTTYSFGDFFATFEYDNGPVTRKKLLNNSQIEQIVEDGLYFESKSLENYIQKAKRLKKDPSISRYIDNKHIWPYFNVYKLDLLPKKNKDRFMKHTHDIFVAQGEVKIILPNNDSFTLKAGESCIISEFVEGYKIETKTKAQVFFIGQQEE